MDSYNSTGPVLDMKEIENCRNAPILDTTTNRTLERGLDVASHFQALHEPTFSFLKLPREVRDLIYTYALKREKSVKPQLSPAASKYLRNLYWKPKGPSICLLNQQIWEEANIILYSTNVFRFSNGYALRCFEAAVGKDNLDLIRRIEISLESEHCTTAHSNRLYYEQYVHRELAALPDGMDIAKALSTSGLLNITEMTIMANKWEVKEQGLRSFGPDLESAICEVLKRNPEVRSCLRLAGYLDSEREKFSEQHEIKTEILDYSVPLSDTILTIPFAVFPGPDLSLPGADTCWYGRSPTRRTEPSFFTRLYS